MTVKKSIAKTTAKKSATKTAAKRKAVAKELKKDVRKGVRRNLTWIGIQSDLADFLNLSDSQTNALKRKGLYEPDENGEFDVMVAVRQYVTELRSRKSGTGSKSDLDAELQYWKIEKAKNSVRDFRMNRDREVCLAVLSALTNAMAELKKELGSDPGVGRAIDRFIERINAVDVDGVSYLIEGEGDEDEDD